MASEYLSAQQLADITGKTARAIRASAEKGAWPYIEESARGGQVRRYSFDGLPEQIRLDVQMARQIQAGSCLPALSNGIAIFPVSDDRSRKALAKADLLRHYQAHMSRTAWGNKDKHRKRFMVAYNSGQAYPEIFGILGEVKWQTIEGWKQKVSSCGDPLCLADARGVSVRGQRSIDPSQAAVLLAVLRSPMKKKSEIIKTAKVIMEKRGVADGLSDWTYRRWIEEWIAQNYDEWVFWREGDAGLHNRCLPWVPRDYDKIEVGDVVVADGHVLNFLVLNPWTGKPKRMTMVLWYDMKSSYALGWEIMPSENIQSIHAALRRSILVLGKIPRAAYLDNGKAFRARVFTQQQIDFEQAGVAGLYQRLGISTMFAWPYHGQSKTIERFFQTFGELERLSPTYVGTSIEDKPPHMHMGEKLHRKIQAAITCGSTPTLEQAHMAIAGWFDEYHRRTQRGHLDGACPLEVFEAGRGQGVDPVALRILMMSEKVKTIRRNGIWWAGEWYYSPQLYGRKHRARFLYDWHHRDSVLVYDESGENYICEATRMTGVHPAARILGNDADVAELESRLEMKGALRKLTVTSAREFAEAEIIPETRRRLEAMGMSSGDPLALPAPEKKRLPGKLTAAEEEKIMADAERIQAETESIRPADTADSVCMPEVEDESATYWTRLEKVSDMDRYEACVDAEVRGWLIPKQWSAFRAYYEQTPEYARQAEYWEEYRVKQTMMYCQN